MWTECCEALREDLTEGVLLDLGLDKWQDIWGTGRAFQVDGTCAKVPRQPQTLRGLFRNVMWVELVVFSDKRWQLGWAYFNHAYLAWFPDCLQMEANVGFWGLTWHRSE